MERCVRRAASVGGSEPSSRSTPSPRTSSRSPDLRDGLGAACSVRRAASTLVRPGKPVERAPADAATHSPKGYRGQRRGILEHFRSVERFAPRRG
jgi:hypothetical protein